MLWVLEVNVRARKFYEQMGFREDGATKDEVTEGTTLHELRYRLALDKTS